MSTTITMEDAQANLPELVAHLGWGEELIITKDHKPVARLMREQTGVRQARKAGSAKGKLIILQEDNEHLKDFEEYM